MEKLCYGCMRLKQRSPLCEHCGYNENIDNWPHQLPIGTILRERYEVGKSLGQGGFGITYIGRDIVSGEILAIKEFYPRAIVSRDSSKTRNLSISDAEESFRNNRERFLREARTLAKFTHIPSVVHVYDFFEENNTAYIVMEYIQGVNLKTYINLRGGRLSPEHTLRLLTPVMDALEAIHAGNLVHRDISPDNIMIQPNGSAKLLDFGAARQVEQGPDGNNLLSTEAILKHGFAPIEQYQRRGNLGPWSDVYAFCGTIYYCLTSRIPRDATERITDDPNMHWDQIPGLTARQIQTLEWGMAPSLRNRAQSIGQLRSGLELPKMQTENGRRQPERTGFPTQEKEISMVSRKLPPEKKEEPKPPAKPKPVEKPKPPEKKPGKLPEKKNSGVKKGLVAAVLALVLMAGLGIGIAQMTGQKATVQNQLRQETEPFQTVQEAPTEYLETLPETTPAAVMGTLRSDVVSVDGWGDGQEVVRPVFGSSEYNRNKIGTLTFLDSLEKAPENAMDVSQEKNGSVLCWFKSGEGGYDMYIAGEGGVKAPQDCTTLFAFYSNLRSIDFNNCFFTENMTSMHDMFLLCESLETLDLQGWDTSNVTDMISTFHLCRSLRQINLAGIDTSSVTDMGYLFSCCESLESLNVSSFDTSNVISMCSMFENCRMLPELNLSGFNTAKVTDMSYLFNGCTMLRKVDVTSFNTSCVTDMFAMFEGCAALWELDLGSFDTSKVRDMSFLFSECMALNSVNVSSFETSNVINMLAMFRNCQKLSELDLSGFDTAMVTDMGELFSGCKSLQKVDVTSFDTGAVTNMNAMFKNCSSLSELDIRGFDTRNVTNMGYMFHGCTALPELDFSNFDISSVTQYENFMENEAQTNGQPWKELFTGGVKPQKSKKAKKAANETSAGFSEEVHTFSRETFGNTVMIIGENLSIQVTDGKRVIITVEGLELENGYSTNKWGSYQDQLEYYWGLEMEGETTYSVATAFWATKPRSVTFTTLEQMTNSAFSIDANGVYKKMGHVDMSHTKTSITWSFTINRYYPSGFENANKFVVKVVDSSTDKEILRTYTLEE